MLEAGLALVALGFGLLMLALAAVALVRWRAAAAEAARLRERYGGIDDVSTELERRRTEAAGLAAEVAAEREALAREVARARSEVEMSIQNRRKTFETSYAAAVEQLERLSREVRTLDEQAELQAFGLYKPYYDFDTSEEYKRRLEAVRAEQAGMLKAKSAAVCAIAWTVDGDLKKGAQMVDRVNRLMIRAFNGECDALVAKVRFNNVTAIEERVRKAFEAINKLGEPNRCSIVAAYLDLKLAEVRLAWELQDKIRAEREAERTERERIREEEVAQREFERAQREAEAEERRYEAALAKARADLAGADAARHAAMESRVADLEARLAEAHARKERAISQAQLTRAGHVYVISNEGSFGGGVLKIGMTRRLEPLDRVRELGDASVPFGFDVHALIYSEDAPGLESALHRHFASRRVNLVNDRKEFFEVTIDEVEAVVRERAGDGVTFHRLAVAEEYRRSTVIRASAASTSTAAAEDPAASRVEAERARLRALSEGLA